MSRICSVSGSAGLFCLPEPHYRSLLIFLLECLCVCIKRFHFYGYILGGGGTYRGLRLRTGPVLRSHSLYSVKISHWFQSISFPTTLACLGIPSPLVRTRIAGSWHANVCPFPWIFLVWSLTHTPAKKGCYPRSHLPSPPWFWTHNMYVLAALCALSHHITPSDAT